MDKFFKRCEDANNFGIIPAFFILNEFSEQKKVHEGILKQIDSSFDVPVLKSKLNSRVAYTEVSVIGQGVFEYSDPKAKN